MALGGVDVALHPLQVERLAGRLDPGAEECDEIVPEHLVRAREHQTDHLARGLFEREEDKARVIPRRSLQPPHGGGRPGVGDVVTARERCERNPRDPGAVVPRELEQRLDRRLRGSMLGDDGVAEERVLEQLGARGGRVPVPLLERSSALVDE